jgi:DNA-binding response OmpR family regulator
VVCLDEHPEMIALRRRVRELEEELAEWRRRGERDEEEDTDTLERLLAWRAKLGPTGRGNSPAALSVLAYVLDRPGRLHRKWALAEQTPRRNEGSDPRIVDVYVCGLRHVLLKHYGDDVIRTVWGQGYRVEPDDAKALLSWLDGVQAAAAA